MERTPASGIAPVGEDLEQARALIDAGRGAKEGPLHLLAETTSTNDEAKWAAKEGAPHGSVWVAEVQSAGRGRQGRSWLSARGENLLFSLLVRPDCPVANLPPLTIAAGLAVRDAVAALAPAARVRVKWPNDVVVGDDRKKVAGILVETVTQGPTALGVIVGVGINVHGREFPKEIRETATSVSLIANSPPHRGELLTDVLVRLDHELIQVARGGLGLVHARFLESDALAGEFVESELGSGIARGIDLHGRLLVEQESGAQAAWMSGEVHLSKRSFGRRSR